MKNDCAITLALIVLGLLTIIIARITFIHLCTLD